MLVLFPDSAVPSSDSVLRSVLPPVPAAAAVPLAAALLGRPLAPFLPPPAMPVAAVLSSAAVAAAAVVGIGRRRALLNDAPERIQLDVVLAVHFVAVARSLPRRRCDGCGPIRASLSQYK